VTSGPETEFVLADLKSYGVGIDHCVYHEGKKLPVTTAIISRKTGSRTIVHYRDLPELTIDDFRSKIPLNNYRWIHFEGRNAAEVSKMIEIIEEYKSTLQCKEMITVSVELEKCRPELMTLLPKADVVRHLCLVYLCLFFIGHSLLILCVISMVHVAFRQRLKIFL
jgi:ketohexokinase